MKELNLRKCLLIETKSHDRGRHMSGFFCGLRHCERSEVISLIKKIASSVVLAMTDQKRVFIFCLKHVLKHLK